MRIAFEISPNRLLPCPRKIRKCNDSGPKKIADIILSNPRKYYGFFLSTYIHTYICDIFFIKNSDDTRI